MAGDSKTRRSLPVEVERGQEPVLILNEHKVEWAKALGWEYLPAGLNRKGLATHDGLLVISDAGDQAGPVRDWELGQALLAAKKAYERQHPETRRAACGGGRNGKGTRRKTGLSGSDTPVPRFTLRAAEALGVGETRIKGLIRIVNELKGDARKRFARGEMNRSEALRRLGPANGQGTPPGRHLLAKAIYSLERALEGPAEISEENRRRLERLAVLIQEAIGKTGRLAPEAMSTASAGRRKGGNVGNNALVLCRDGAIRVLREGGDGEHE